MKKLLRLIFLLTIVFVSSCEEHGLIVNCQECTTEEPKNAEIQIKIAEGYHGASAIITIYEGNLEDGIIYKTINGAGAITKTTVTLNKKYTFTATYYYPDNYYTTVDSATPRVSYNKDQCDDPCYYIYDRTVDLRLKYTK